MNDNIDIEQSQHHTHIQVSWQDLKDFCADVGPVEHAEVLEYSDGRKTGSGIVKFYEARDARAAIKELYDVELQGRPIFIREDKENGEGPGSKGYEKGKGGGKGPREKGKGKGKYGGGKGGEGNGKDADRRQLYVGNLSFDTSWQNLKDHMSQCGDVEYADVGKGWGLVRFARRGDAENAMDELTETDLDGRKIFVREDREGGKI